MHHDREKYEFSQKISVMCHAAFLELRSSACCKVDVISVKTRCIMTEKKYRFSQNHLYHAIFGRLRLSLFFSDNDIWKADFISVKTGCIIIHKEIFLSCSSCRFATNHFLEENNICNTF